MFYIVLYYLIYIIYYIILYSIYYILLHIIYLYIHIYIYKLFKKNICLLELNLFPDFLLPA